MFAAALDDGLLFHDSFEPGTPAYAHGRPDWSGKDSARTTGFDGGVGMQTSADGLLLSAPGNFNYPQGSLSFWVRMPPEPAAVAVAADAAAISPPEHIRLFHTENFEIRHNIASRSLTFMTGKTMPGDGYRWDYNCSTRPPDSLSLNDWTHIAITWDAETGRKELWCGGRLHASSQTGRIRETPPAERLQIRFGGGGKDALPLQFDTIDIWKRVLTAAEVAGLANPAHHAARAAAIAAMPPPAPPANSAPETLRADIMMIPVNRIEDTIIAPGETFTVSIPIKNTSGRPFDGQVRLTLEDFFGNTVASHEQPVSLAPGKQTTITRAFSPAAQGIYRVALTVHPAPALAPAAPAPSPPPAPAERVRDIATFVVWPRDARLSDDSWFGVHVNSWADGHVVRQAARLGFRRNRNHNMLQTTWWTRAQFDPGPFRWDQETSLTWNIEAGMNIMGQFLGCPWWAARDGELPRLPNTYPSGAVPRPDAFATYVTETVNRYKDRIHLWEIGNEPDVSMFWRGTPEEFSGYVHAAARAARAADPQALIVGSGYSSNDSFTRAAAQAGALRPLDALSFHLYHSPENPPEAYLARFEERLAFFRDLLARHTDHPATMPVYQSEGGSTSTTFLRGAELPKWPPPGARPPPNWRAAAIRQVQSDVLLLGLGFTASWSYLWNPGREYSSLCELDINNTPKPKIVARAALAAALDGYRFHTHVRRPGDARFWAALFTNPETNYTRAVVWTGDNGRVAIATARLADSGRPPAGLRDLMGAPLPVGEQIEFDDTPRYLTSTLTGDQLAARLQDSAALQIKNPAAPLPVEKEERQDAGIPKLPDYAAPLENPAGLHPVDLRAHANMALADEKAGDGKGGWADEGPFNDARELPAGRLTAYGVPFDIIDPANNNNRAIITLRGQNVTPAHPLRADAIPVNRARLRALYFLHTAAWGVPGHIGHYTLHYADGTTADLPLDIGKNTANWWTGHTPGEDSRPWPIRVTNTLNGKPAWRYLRVWEWQNPKPDTPVRSIDFVSDGSRQTPILVALTAATWPR
ncbi:MAG: hypothetical protein LBK99_13985 [Opitutaceae bacterium]|jgi:hypothetical protein|nr:hypothetical protein [Opitutaceae bacterium]